MKRKLKKPVIYGLYASVFVILIGSLFFMKTDEEYNYDSDYEYVSKLFDSTVPVVKETENLIKPFTDESIKTLKNFYNYKGKEEEQEDAIINYEQTYIQNNGIAYGNGKEFDVVASLSGTVTSIKEDKLQGLVIEIESEGAILTYKSLSSTTLKQNDEVKLGSIIGKSGTSNINKDLGNHIVFELNIDNNYVNPDDYYGKEIKS